MPDIRQPGPIEQLLASSGREDIRRLCQMANLELMDLMDAQLLRSDVDFDEELFDAARTLLDERAPMTAHVDPQASEQAFMRKHEHMFTAKKDPANDSVSKKRIHHSPLRWISGVAAALIIAFGLFCLGAVAAGKSPIEVITDLSDTVIRSVTWGPTGMLEITGETEGYRSLEEALLAVDAADAQQITWIPGDFYLSSVDAQKVKGRVADDGVKIWAYYESAQGELVYNIAHNPHASTNYMIEKNPGTVGVVIGGTEVQILQNNDRIQAQWVDGDFYYILTGEVSRRDFENIILSLK